MPSLDSPERTTHRQRVAHLCGVVSKALSLEELAEFALVLAARFHDDRHNFLQGRSEAAPQGSPIESFIADMAQAILRPIRQAKHGKRHRCLKLCAQIFEACDEFDHTVELAEYEQSSIRVAIDEFLSGAAGRFDPSICEALSRIASPRADVNLAGRLPVLPSAAARLMKTSSADTSVFELETIAASDPVLAARLLGAANSALLGYSFEIRDLRSAIARLGIPAARKVLMNALFSQLFASATLRELWSHSTLVAAAAHELAGACGYEPEVAWVAGLLHDIGRLVLYRSPPSACADEADLLAAGFPRTYAETLVYGTDHAALGSALLRQWNVDSEIVEAVAHHHRPGTIDSMLGAILCLAEDETADAFPENLARGMRRSIAIEITGIEWLAETPLKRDAAIFALAG